MTEMQPLMKEIQEKYKDQPEKLQAEMARLGFGPDDDVGRVSADVVAVPDHDRSVSIDHKRHGGLAVDSDRSVSRHLSIFPQVRSVDHGQQPFLLVELGIARSVLCVAGAGRCHDGGSRNRW